MPRAQNARKMMWRRIGGASMAACIESRTSESLVEVAALRIGSINFRGVPALSLPHRISQPSSVFIKVLPAETQFPVAAGPRAAGVHFVN